MKAHYKLFLSLAIGSFVTFAGCQDDEVVDLVKYPVNQPAITIDDAEGASKATLTAVYKSDGTLELNGPVTRTYTFHFAASPEDATVTFDVINTNIPNSHTPLLFRTIYINAHIQTMVGRKLIIITLVIIIFTSPIFPERSFSRLVQMVTRIIIFQ